MEETFEFEIIKHYPTERKYIILKPLEKGLLKRLREIIFKKTK
ncbi:MAG: hypothetical protein QW153_03900 [Candidatus Bilamarchaeaceae archaeon]